MAKDKKSFILYADQISLIEKLTDEEAGRLVKHLFEYVNDRNPVAVDRLTEIAFEPIKQQLKRDLKDWEETKQLKSKGGKIGMERRWAEHNKNKQGLTEDNLVTKNVTPITVNVNDNVTVNVNDNVTDNTNTHEPEKPKTKKPEIPTEEEFMAYYKSELSRQFPGVEFDVKTKYETWVFNDWKDGYGKKITNWKLKLKSTIPHLKAKFDPNRPQPLSGPLAFSSKTINK
jgi:hypothetical protein